MVIDCFIGDSMRRSIISYCMPVIQVNDDDVNGLSEKLLTDSQVPLVPSHLFYSLHTMRQTRALLLHHIMCQDLLLAQQEELIRKMYGQLQCTTNNYLHTLKNIYNNEKNK